MGSLVLRPHCLWFCGFSRVSLRKHGRGMNRYHLLDSVGFPVSAGFAVNCAARCAAIDHGCDSRIREEHSRRLGSRASHPITRSFSTAASLENTTLLSTRPRVYCYPTVQLFARKILLLPPHLHTVSTSPCGDDHLGISSQLSIHVFRTHNRQQPPAPPESRLLFILATYSWQPLLFRPGCTPFFYPGCPSSPLRLYVPTHRLTPTSSSYQSLIHSRYWFNGCLLKLRRSSSPGPPLCRPSRLRRL